MRPPRIALLATRAEAARSYLGRVGLIDGLWTITSSIGSKVQTIAVVAIAGRLDGVTGAAAVILVTSIGVLAATVIDLGLSPQILRVYAAGDITDRRLVIRPLMTRLVVHVPLVAIAAGVLGAPVVEAGSLWLWILATVAYSIGFHASQTMTQLAYGLFRFKSGALLNGTVRTVSIPAMLLILVMQASPALLVLMLGIGEIIIAALQYRKTASNDREGRLGSKALAVGATWRFGVASIANVVANRSDTVAVSTVASPTTIGLYGIASQIETALTTTALVPAGAVASHTARSSSKGGAATGIAMQVGAVVAVLYCLAAVPVFIFTEPLAHLIFGFDVSDPTPIRICLVAGIFSCVAATGSSRLAGLGQQQALVIAMGASAAVGIIGLVVGAMIAGAVGVAVGALLRDVTFFILAWGGASALARRPRTGP